MNNDKTQCGAGRGLFLWLWAGGVSAYIALSFLPIDIPLSDKVIFSGITLDQVTHFLFFTTLAASSVLGFRGARPLILAIVFVFLLAIVLELAHLYIPRRVFSTSDLLANCLGCVGGLATGGLIRVGCSPKPPLATH